MHVIRRHFLACEDIAGGSDLSAGETFFSQNTEALPVGPSYQVVRPWTQLSASPCTVLFQWKSVVDHINHAAPSAPRWWMTARPRKGVFIFLCVIRRHFLACEDIAGGSDLSAGETFFSQNI